VCRGETRLVHRLSTGPATLVDKLRRPGRRLVEKPLAGRGSNIHSKRCPKGPTFTVEPVWGAIPGAVPGDRTDDRKAAGHGPSGGSTITSNRDGRCASRQTASSFGRCRVYRSIPPVPRPRPPGADHPERRARRRRAHSNRTRAGQRRRASYHPLGLGIGLQKGTPPVCGACCSAYSPEGRSGREAPATSASCSATRSPSRRSFNNNPSAPASIQPLRVTVSA
jgi:hypothetical protein